MPATYIREQHLDVESRLLEAEGMKESVTPKPVGKTCLQCENLNSLDADYCDLCNMPLDRERLDALKTQVDATYLQSLLKQTLKEAKADLIAEVRNEIDSFR